MALDKAPVLFTLSQECDPFGNAEMVPIGLIRRLTAGKGDFFERADKRDGGRQEIEDVGIGLTLEISDEIAEQVTKIDDEQKDKEDIEKRIHGWIGHRIEQASRQQEIIQVADQENQNVLQGVKD